MINNYARRNERWNLASFCSLLLLMLVKSYRKEFRRELQFEFYVFESPRYAAGKLLFSRREESY